MENKFMFFLKDVETISQFPTLLSSTSINQAIFSNV